MATRLGVDIGGTFTDLIFYDERTGAILVGKEPTTPSDPQRGVIAAIENTVARELVHSAEWFLHGTTVGLNALLERRGAVVGLLATAGFRDVLEIRRGDRADPYDLVWVPPKPLVPRRLRRPVRGRVLANGDVAMDIVEADVVEALAAFHDACVEAVAVAFINSYANPSHELAAERVLREHGFEGEISLSHRVSGEYREYERTSTTVIDAYVRPLMSRYLEALEQDLRTVGFSGRALLMRSGGGAMTFAEAARRPFEAIMSGPVAGAEGAAELARELQLGDVITADVGGTSFDTCLITGGRPQLMYEGSIVGCPVQTPWVDVRSVGAGGGSIAYIDDGGLMRVGPASAGAVPGPAAYARGGDQPTVTDAALLLGMLAEGTIAAGMTLRRDLAEAAIAPLCEALELDQDAVCAGVLRIVASTMADAIREITVEKGRDPRQATLMAFGGAGSLFATRLARELGISQIVLPQYAGNFSAWGLLGADLRQSRAQTRLIELSDAGLVQVRGEAEALFDELERRAEGINETTARELALDVRYGGQEHALTITVPVDESGALSCDANTVRRRFEDEYRSAYSLNLDEDVQIVAVRATVSTPLPRRGIGSAVALRDDSSPVSAAAQAFSFTAGGWLTFQVRGRSSIAVGDVVEGPAIILEATATTYLDDGFVARAGPLGMLFITDAERRA